MKGEIKMKNEQSPVAVRERERERESSNLKDEKRCRE